MFAGATASAQNGLTVVSIDYLRVDKVANESRHEILPMAVFDGQQFLPVRQYDRGLGIASTRRPDLLGRYRTVQVLHRGRRIGTVSVSEIYAQRFHCSALVVGSGEAQFDEPMPVSEISDAVQGSRQGRAIDYETHAFVATSGAADAVRLYGEPLVVDVRDRTALDRFAKDVEALEPRRDLLPLGEDETRAYRLAFHNAVVVVRKRRSAEMLAGPADVELESPLMTDIVVVRTEGRERVVDPLFISTTGADAWGKGPQDYFVDAFELYDGNVYLVFERRDYESVGLRLYRLGPAGAPTEVFEGDMYGC